MIDGSRSNHGVIVQATGPFDVKLVPQPPGPDPEDTALGRLTIDKQFHGDLDATSRGQMLAAQGTVTGSAGYVAMERVTGVLHGRRGTFVLMHTGIMNRGEPSLSISVVPDSGTDELTGLAGTMNIVIAPGGKHSYEFEYAIA